MSTKRTRSGSNLGLTVVTKTRGGAATRPAARTTKKPAARAKRPAATAAVLARPGPRPVGRRADHPRRPAGPGPVGQAARSRRPRRRHRAGALAGWARVLLPLVTAGAGFALLLDRPGASTTTVRSTRAPIRGGWPSGRCSACSASAGWPSWPRARRRSRTRARSARRAAISVRSSAARCTPASDRRVPPSCSSPSSSWPSWSRRGSRWPRSGGPSPPVRRGRTQPSPRCGGASRS